MRAAVLERFDQDLVLAELPEPEPGPGELLVRVRAAGLCGTDVKITSGALPGLELPRVPGHEVAGEVVAAGHGFEAGQRVAVYPLQSCGHCAACRRGDTETCYEAVRIGFERDGGLAELVAVPAANLVPFDGGIEFEQAAVAMDAVLTSLRALRHRAQAGPGDAVLIVGAGGLGLHGVQIAVADGAAVAVVDPLASHRELALRLGAELALAPEQLPDAVKEWRREGVDVAVEFSGSPEGFRAGAEALRPGGLLVCTGYRPGADYALDSSRLALAQLRIEGNRGGRVEHGREAIAAVAAGEVEPLIDRVGELGEVNELLGELRAGRVTGRVVVRL